LLVVGVRGQFLTFRPTPGSHSRPYARTRLGVPAPSHSESATNHIDHKRRCPGCGARGFRADRRALGNNPSAHFDVAEPYMWSAWRYRESPFSRRLCLCSHGRSRLRATPLRNRRRVETLAGADAEGPWADTGPVSGHRRRRSVGSLFY